MQKLLYALVWLVLATTVGFAGQEVKPPTLIPVPQLEKHRDMVRQAVSLHDQGQFNDAIKIYQQILSENPDDLGAIYEMGFSYFTKGDHQKSLETAYKGAQYKSDLLVGFYTLIGNSLDNLGQTEKALKVYREAVKQFPRNGLLHFNLAITLLRTNKPQEAKKSFKEAAKSSPQHASTHLRLSQLWLSENYRVPALLAACRFLMVEPNSSRSPAVLQVVSQIAWGNVQKGKEPNSITVVIDPESKTDEGDFNTIQAALGIVGATRHLEDSRNKSEARLLVEALNSLFAIMSEGDRKSSGFAWDYYRPYFSDMSRRKLVEPFGYYIQQSSGSKEVSDWLQQHADQVQSLVGWSRSFKWPDE